ncbi:MAG: hypothetical protein ACT4PX_10350 [Actinomycetota bacterium]
MAIVWLCSLSVDEYLAAGRTVVVPRPDCPDCTTAMSFWSGYERSVRVGGPCHKLWVRRARCGLCRSSHALIPSFCLVGRLDVVEVVGELLAEVIRGDSVVQVAAERIDVPHTTARDWVRRFTRRAAVLAAGFAAAVVEVSGIAPVLVFALPRQALEAIEAAFAAVGSRAGPALVGLWTFAGLVTGGGLLATTTNPPWFVFGNRRFIPPVPQGH